MAIANLRGEGRGPRLTTDFNLTTQGAEATVFDDDADDKRFGGSGRGWFIASLDHKDRITDVHAGAFADDLD